MDSVLRGYFLGKGFAKPRLLIFEIRRDFVLGFRAQEESGEECGADSFLGFGGVGKEKSHSKILEWL